MGKLVGVRVVVFNLFFLVYEWMIWILCSDCRIVAGSRPGSLHLIHISDRILGVLWRGLLLSDHWPSSWSRAPSSKTSASRLPRSRTTAPAHSPVHHHHHHHPH
jgi:hypothetical protein